MFNPILNIFLLLFLLQAEKLAKTQDASIAEHLRIGEISSSADAHIDGLILDDIYDFQPSLHNLSITDLEIATDNFNPGEGLCLQQLEALVKMVPTKEEETKLSSYKGAVDDLGSAEKFLRALVRVPFAFQRAEAMLYRETFEDEVVHLRNSFSMLEEACKELKSSRLFLKLLEAVLKTGNRMNVGTIRGGAKAFQLDEQC